MPSRKVTLRNSMKSPTEQLREEALAIANSPKGIETLVHEILYSWDYNMLSNQEMFFVRCLRLYILLKIRRARYLKYLYELDQTYSYIRVCQQPIVVLKDQVEAARKDYQHAAKDLDPELVQQIKNIEGRSYSTSVCCRSLAV